MRKCFKKYIKKKSETKNDDVTQCELAILNAMLQLLVIYRYRYRYRYDAN